MKVLILSILLIVCGPFLLIGIYEGWQNYNELRTLNYAKGTVVRNVYTTILIDGNEAGAYQPVVEFATSRDEKATFTDKVGSLPADYEPGSSVGVIFDPTDPQATARLYSWKSFWLVPALLSTVGLLPIIVALVLMRRFRL